MTDEYRKSARSPFRAGMLVIPLLALAIGGCSSLGSTFGFGGNDQSFEDDFIPSEPPAKLYNEGLALLNSGKSKDALEKFEEVDDVHPYSSYARRSMLMSAYLNFQRGNYDETVNEARRYVTLYPSSEDAAYAQYMIGESYFRQIPDITRDQAMSNRALSAMREVIRKYPDSEYVDDAKNKIQVAEDQIAGKEMQTGRYYQERGEYLAAVNRFKYVVENYQATRHIEEALLRLTETYLALGIVPEAQTAAAVLGHNFPDSQWYADAYRVLGNDGLEPNENQRSWISRAFRVGA